MKHNRKYKIAGILAAAMAITSGSFAQSWNLAGNADATASSMLGTTNLQSLTIKTNNTTRATFSYSGGLNMSTGIKFSSVADGIVFPSVVANSSPTPMISMFPYTSNGFFLTNADRMVISHSPYFSNWGIQYQDNGDKFNFLSNGTNVMTVSLGTKRVGITTNAPAYPLHVTGDHTTGYVTSALLDPDEAAFKVEAYTFFNYGVRGMYVKASSGNKTGTAGYFESDFISVDGHSSSSGGTNYGISGVAGGTGGVKYGVYGKANSGDLNYALYGTTSGSGTKYALYANGNIGGTGTFSYTSDARLKKNIVALDKIMDKIMQLKPSMYQFKVGEFGDMNLPEGKHFGLLAQDLQKVLPELVAKNIFPAQYDAKGNKVKDEIEYLGVNYNELIPLLIAAVQEQQKTINQKDEELEQLKSDVAAIKQMLSGNSVQAVTAPQSNAMIAGAKLSQNAPNPFYRSTSIGFTIPEAVKSAKLIVSDINGRAVKSFTITARGNGQQTIDAGALTAGTYTYTLIADGVTIDSKKMMLTK